MMSGDKMILIFQERKRRLIEIRGGALPPVASVRLPRAAGGRPGLCAVMARARAGPPEEQAPESGMTLVTVGRGAQARWLPRRRNKRTLLPSRGNSIRRQEARSLSAPDGLAAASRASSPRLPSPCCGLGSLLGPQSRVLAP